MQLFGNKNILPINAEEQMQEAQNIVNRLKPIKDNIATKSYKYYTEKILFYILEYSLYVGAVLCVLFMFYAEDITPFYIIKEIKARPEIANRISNSDDWQVFLIALKVLILLPALFMLIIALMLKKRRKLLVSLYAANNAIGEQTEYFEKKINQLQTGQK